MTSRWEGELHVNEDVNIPLKPYFYKNTIKERKPIKRHELII